MGLNQVQAEPGHELLTPLNQPAGVRGWGVGKERTQCWGFFKAWMTRLKWGWEAWDRLREERASHHTEAKKYQCLLSPRASWRNLL